MVMIQKSGVEEQMKFVTRQNEIEMSTDTIKICLPKKTTKINSPNTENNNE